MSRLRTGGDRRLSDKYTTTSRLRPPLVGDRGAARFRAAVRL